MTELFMLAFPATGAHKYLRSLLFPEQIRISNHKIYKRYQLLQAATEDTQKPTTANVF